MIAFTIAFGLMAAILTAHSVAGRVLYTAKLFAFPLSILALLGAFYGVVAFVRARQLASTSMMWPTVTGIVIASAFANWRKRRRAVTARDNPLPVYYDPERLGTAVLEPDSRQGSLAPLILVAIRAVVGGVPLAFFIKVSLN